MWSHRQWPCLLGSFPIVDPTVTPQPCPLPLLPAHHWPIALSVFIDLGKSGGELEGHNTSRTTHSQQSAEQRAGRTFPGASPGFTGVVAVTGDGSPVDMLHQPLGEGRAWGVPRSHPSAMCHTDMSQTLQQRPAPGYRGWGRGVNESVGRKSGGQCTQPRHLPGMEGEREAHREGEQSGGTPGLPCAQAPSQGSQQRCPLGLCNGPSGILTVL